MANKFLKCPSLVIGNIICLFINLVLSIMCFCLGMDKFVFYIPLITLSIVYLLTICILLGYRIVFDDDKMYITLFGKRKSFLVKYEDIKKVDIYPMRGVRLDLHLSGYEVIGLEYSKKVASILCDKCNEEVNDYIKRFMKRRNKKAILNK